MHEFQYDVDSVKQDQEEFIKNNKITLKTQERFRSVKYNAFLRKLIRLL